MDVIKDLGHEDIQDGACKDGRSRTWMLLLYEDDPTHKAVLDGMLDDLDWNYAGRIHDSDDGVKVHHHVVVLFKDGRKASDVAKNLGIDTRWLRAWDRQKKALRYLCHRDNPEKYQYTTDGIYGTLAEKAVSACSKGNELGEAQSVREIVQLIHDVEGIITYAFFLDYVADKGYYPVFRRMGNLATRLIDEHNSSYQAQLDKELRNQRVSAEDRRMFDGFVVGDSAEPEKIGFVERVDAMTRFGIPESPLTTE